MCNYIKQATKNNFFTSGLRVMFITKITQDSKIKDILKSTSGFTKSGVIETTHTTIIFTWGGVLIFK
jgi:hypothetical protein